MGRISQQRHLHTESEPVPKLPPAELAWVWASLSLSCWASWRLNLTLLGWAWGTKYKTTQFLVWFQISSSCWASFFGPTDLVQFYMIITMLKFKSTQISSSWFLSLVWFQLSSPLLAFSAHYRFKEDISSPCAEHISTCATTKNVMFVQNFSCWLKIYHGWAVDRFLGNYKGNEYVTGWFKLQC